MRSQLRRAMMLGLVTMISALPAGAQVLAAGSGTSRTDSLEAGSESAHVVAPEAAQAEGKCTRCGERTFGTSIPWVSSVPEAARRAQAEQKLVFVLHVSGHFETAGYT